MADLLRLSRDPRFNIREGDVAVSIASGSSAFDAIC